MATNPFVDPEIVRIDLSTGDFIDIKKELNAGEHRRVFTGLVDVMTAGEKTTLKPEKVGVTKVLGYILNWSFINKDGTPAEVNERALDRMNQAMYAEIVKAIDEHEDGIEKARTERKNETGGTQQSEAISPSVV